MNPTGLEPDLPSVPLSGELFEEIVRRVTDMLTTVEQENSITHSVETPVPRVETAVPQSIPPRAPRTVSESGLRPGLLSNLILKWSSVQASTTLQTLVELVRLPGSVIHDILSQLSVQGAMESDSESEESSQWRLTESGKRRAMAAFAECRYLGPAPVSRAEYLQRCEQEAVHNLQIRREHLLSGLKPLVLSRQLVDSLGAGLCTGHSMLLYGDSGNGKSSIAKRLGEIVKLVGGPIHVPDAIAIDHKIIAFFDPEVHKPVQVEGSDSDVEVDRRWRLVSRPLIQAPSCIQPELFDFPENPAGQLLHAPVQLKANGGVLLLDDLGRQRFLPEIADRWLRILEHQSDTLRLGPDHEVTLPVTGLTLFVTHHSPAESFDSTLLRRIKLKVNIQSPDEHQFREIFRNLCQQRGIHYDDWVVLRCLSHRYNPQISPKASDPRDLLDAITAICRFEGESPRLTEDLLAQAFQRTVVLNEASV